ncbi:MAG TPA: hypothetical protein VJN93_00125 [Candidatus Acidoferrum sp.]|nr:hypothetical protein [Candidatus Acidoferrum sp.]
MRILALTLCAWIGLSVFQQANPLKLREAEREPARHSQEKTEANKKIGDGAVLRNAPTDTADTKSNRRESDNYQKVVVTAPEKTVDTVERVVAIAGLICTIALTVVGICGICVAIKTLKALRIQAAIARRQTGHIARQAQSMRYQTTLLRNSVIQARRGARAAKISADAAKASADAAIAAERAWVMVSLEKVPITGSLLTYGTSWRGGEEFHGASVRVRCICMNQGKTPAKIIEKRAAVVFVTENSPLSDTPNLDIETVDPVPYPLQAYPGPGQIVDLRLDTKYEISESEKDMTSFFVVYGVVKYQHLFSERIVQTTFGYKIRLDSILERLIEHPEYNKNN